MHAGARARANDEAKPVYFKTDGLWVKRTTSPAPSEEIFEQQHRDDRGRGGAEYV